MEKAEALAEKEKAAKDREIQLTQELQENITNSAHDMKSPACALALAVDSLVSSFYGKTHIDKDGCKMAMETMKGMMHTLSSLNTLINRSVVPDVIMILVYLTTFFRVIESSSSDFYFSFCFPFHKYV